MGLGRAAGAVLLVGVLCLPAAALAQSATQGTFKAASAAWDAADPTLNGQFVVLYNRAQASTTSGTSADDSWFQVHAGHLRVEVDSEDWFIETPAASVSPLPDFAGSSRTEAKDFEHASITGEASREGRFLYLFPYGQGITRIEAGCAKAKPVPPSTVPNPLNDPNLNPNQVGPQDYASNGTRNLPSADTSNTLHLEACQGQSLGVFGSFLLVLWDWDATARAQDASFAIVTGKTAPLPFLDGQGNRPYAGMASEAFIFVQDGEFRIRGNEGNPSKLFLSQAALQQVGTLTLFDANGQIGNVGHVEGVQVGLDGLLSVGLSPSTTLVSATIGGLLKGLDVDGEHTDFGPAPQTVTSDPARLGLAPVIFAVLLPLALVAWGLLRRRRRADPAPSESLTPREQRAQTQASLARRDLAEGHLTRALRHATCAVRLAPAEAAHRVLRMVVLREAGRQMARPALIREAEREQAKLNRDLTEAEERAWTHAEATELLCSLGRRDEALASLQQAAREDAGFVVRRLLEGGYRLLWDEPWVRALRGPPAAQVDPAFS